MKLAGKRALITGGSQGFGLAVARAFIFGARKRSWPRWPGGSHGWWRWLRMYRFRTRSAAW